MSGYIIVILVGVFVASLVAFAINVMVPGSDSTSTEDRLADMASRRQKKDEPERSSLLEGIDETYTPFSRLLENLPAIADYLDQADIPMQSGRFVVMCIASFVGGILCCALTPVPILLAPFAGVHYLRRSRLAGWS